jgi:hypothetical protein
VIGVSVARGLLGLQHGGNKRPPNWGRRLSTSPTAWVLIYVCLNEYMYGLLFVLLPETHYLINTSKKKCRFRLPLTESDTSTVSFMPFFHHGISKNCRHHDVGDKVLATCWIELILLFGNFLENNLSLSLVIGWEIEYAT